ncbi:MAG: single-stranded DNA-binding protein [Bacteroidetes bacterium]|nr:MAG: single-stranded DNA-binding protein [Bacteroidota bacterium]
MIKLQVIGNLGKDCLTNQVNGKTVMNFNVAHSEKYKDNAGNQQERTTWVECAYWTERTGIAPYLIKGQQVFVEGTPELRQYVKSDGSAGASLSLRVQSLQLVGGSPNAQGPRPNPASSNTGGNYAVPNNTAPAAFDSDAGASSLDSGTSDLPF